MNPTLAQGSKGWTGGSYNGTSSGVTPLPKPFYVVESGRQGVPDLAPGRHRLRHRHHRLEADHGERPDLAHVDGVGRAVRRHRRAGSLQRTRRPDPDRAPRWPTRSEVSTPRWRGSTGPLTVNGWAIDPDTSDPIDVHVYVDGGWAGALRADTSRPDVGRAVPGYGDAHGYQAVFGGFAPGVHQVCTFAINVGPYGTTNPQLGCASFTVPGDPFGSLDGVTAVPGGIRAEGWAVDPDTSAPIDVHVYVDGAWGTATTGLGRRGRTSSTATRGPAPPTATTSSLPTTGGSHQVCAYGINVGPTGSVNRKLGCATAVVDGSPLGSFDGAVATAGGVSVRGWAFDPDTGDGLGAGARRRRRAGHPRHRPARGLTSAPPIPVGATPTASAASCATGAGTHQVCATALNEGADRHRPLARVPDGHGARRRTRRQRRLGHPGHRRRHGSRGGRSTPTSLGPVQVHVYVNGAWAGVGHGRRGPCRRRRGVSRLREQPRDRRHRGRCPPVPPTCASTPSTWSRGAPTRCSAAAGSDRRAASDGPC